MHGVLLDLDTLGDDLDLGKLEASLDQWQLHPVTSPGQVAERIAGAEVVVSNKVHLDAATIAASPELRFIAVAATGTNNVDLDAARAAGIVVSNVTAYGTPSVAQHVFSLLLALTTRLGDYRAAVADCGCHDNRVDKIWWNEQWMGWPIGPHYKEQSNVTQAHRLEGDLMLIWGELDRNVDPASTMQVIDALVRADKDFEQLVIPGSGHGAAGHPYAKRRQAEFFIRKLK